MANPNNVTFKEAIYCFPCRHTGMITKPIIFLQFTSLLQQRIFLPSFHPPMHQNDVSIKVCGISFDHSGGGNNGATDFGKYNHVEAGVMPV